MKYNNVYKGTRFLIASEIISIIGLLIYIVVAAVMIAVTGGDVSHIVVQHFYNITGNYQIIGISNYVMIGLLIISYIALVIGISKTRNEDTDFDKAFSFVCMGIVAYTIYMLFSGGWIGVLFSAISGILFLFFRLRFISAVGHIAEKIDRNDIKDKVKFYSAVMIAITVMQLVCLFVSGAFLPFSTLTAVTASVLSTVKAVMFIVFLSKTLKMSKEQNGGAL